MTEEQARRYHAAMHAVQSGVMMELELDPKGGTPKHLRVGVNSALCEHAALARLLIAKGIITEHEYYEAIIAEAEEAPEPALWQADETGMSTDPALVARIAQLEAQLATTQKTNTRLIARVVDLEHEIAQAARVVADAARLVSYAELLAERTGGAVVIHPDHYRALAAAIAPYRREHMEPICISHRTEDTL